MKFSFPSWRKKPRKIEPPEQWPPPPPHYGRGLEQVSEDMERWRSYEKMDRDMSRIGRWVGRWLQPFPAAEKPRQEIQAGCYQVEILVSEVRPEKAWGETGPGDVISAVRAQLPYGLGSYEFEVYGVPLEGQATLEVQQDAIRTDTVGGGESLTLGMKRATLFSCRSRPDVEQEFHVKGVPLRVRRRVV